MKRLLPIAFLALFHQAAAAQELFVFTEPASNMPAKSIGIRMNNWLLNQGHDHPLSYRFLPEVMWGANKNLMLHAEGFLSNRNGYLTGDGFGLYGKYRFYTADQVNRHFRMAAFGRVSLNASPIRQEEIDLTCQNSGYAIGWVATQLLHRQAFSTSISFVQATDNGGGNKFPAAATDKAIDVSLSTGRLILPKEYRNYRQVNVNFLLEVLGQHIIGSDKMYIDLAPAVQFIINSQTRIDLGYKYELYSNMSRTAPNGFLIRIEHNLFNIL